MNTSHINIEIKARVTDPSRVRNYLVSQGAEFRGLDRQTDTYFNVRKGRLKLREGNIENNLIFYIRPDQYGPKHSDFILTGFPSPDPIKTILTESLGVLAVVRKKREIYYIGNVKFHIDELDGFGAFVEIEAGNLLQDLSAEELREQCDFYIKELKIEDKDMVDVSYSDMTLSGG